MNAEYTHAIKGLDPVADAFAGTVYSDVVSMKNHTEAEILLYKGVGAVGTSTLTVEACDDVSASNVTAIPFKYQAITSGDTHGALTDATTAGFNTTAGSSQLYRLFVNVSDLTSTGYGYIRLKAVEVANDPVLGGVLITLKGARFESPVQATAIV